MRTFRLFLAGCAAAALLADARTSSALGAVVGASPGSADPTEVRVAVASTGTRSSRWVSLRVHASSSAFAWIVPVRPGALVDLASDAWLEALEDATAPRVIPPDAVPPCGFSGGVEVEGELTHVGTTSPESVAIAGDGPGLVTVLDGWGIAMPSDIAPLVDAAGASGDSFVALRYPAPTADIVTHTLRIVDTSPPDVDLSMTHGSHLVAVTAYAFTTGPAALGTDAVALDPALVLWDASGGSTYSGVRDTLLSTNPGAWLVETSGHSPLFAGESVPGQATDIDAVSAAYFSRAATYGDTAASGGSCAANAAEYAADLSPVGVACPAGALANVGGASCQEVVGAGEIPPDSFRCGGIADDLALALAGLGPGSTWVSRARSVLAPGAFGTDDRVQASGAADASTGPVVTCASYDPACLSPDAGGFDPGSASSSGSGAAAGSSGTTSGSTDNSGSDPGAGAAAAADVATAALDSSDGCGGSSADGSGDSCGSGSGTDSGGADSTSGDGCSGDSGSSSSDGCSGDSGSSSSSNCSLAKGPRPRGGRSPVSRTVLLLAALAAIARRGKRPSPRGNLPPA